MTEVLSVLSKHFRIREASLDNFVFKLYSIGSVTLFIAGSLLCAATQYFGDPIICSFDKNINENLANKYCWIHGSNWIHKSYQSEFDCIVDQEFITSEQDAPDTSYYQWIVFFLFLQGCISLIPYRIWKASEQGVIKGFVSEEVKSAFALTESESTEILLKKHASQFKSILHHNNRFFITFLCCEFLNIVFLYINFYVTNVFLDGKFSTYGFDVTEYYRTPRDLRSRNPMCEVFPTKVSCSMVVVSPGGGVSQRNGLCILSQNIVNEKTFLILFFWYMAMFFVSGIYFVYRICILLIPQFRLWSLSRKIRGKPMDHKLNAILSVCYLGDWFILNQIGKNMNPYFFREFLEKLYSDREFFKKDCEQGEHMPLVEMKNNEEKTS